MAGRGISADSKARSIHSLSEIVKLNVCSRWKSNSSDTMGCEAVLRRVSFPSTIPYPVSIIVDGFCETLDSISQISSAFSDAR